MNENKQAQPVAWPCTIIEADFEADTVTLKMTSSVYSVSAGQHWLCNTAPQPAPAQIAQPFAVVTDRYFDGAGLSLAVHDGVNYMFGDGDCYERDGDTLDGYSAEFLTAHQLEKRLQLTQAPAESDFGPESDTPEKWAAVKAWSEKKATAPTQAQPMALTKLAELLDIWDDGNKDPDYRCYIAGAFEATMAEARVLVAASKDNRVTPEPAMSPEFLAAKAQIAALNREVYAWYKACEAATMKIHAQPAPAPELLEILRRFALATNDGDDQAQGTHYIAKDGTIRCKGSFLALIEEARAAIAKATGEAA